MTSAFSMNSHSPSLPSTSTLSLAVNFTWCTSGSELTPAVCATTSPSERDMARPGMSMCASHTRAGPSIPSSYSTANTRPPVASMRARSSGRSGLWSRDTGTAFHTPSDSSVPRMMRESPTLATNSSESLMQATTAVVPLNSVSMEVSSKISASMVASAVAIARQGSEGKSLLEKMYLVRRSRKNCETRSPASPCPSSAASSKAPVSSCSCITMESWFFLRGL
mmetsp:Transcript_22661/g.72914  ORF Transcript_22661/g.72914 Transcript_22661/m.72914 type:complete len:223 (-) Transcript_22661:424-1092(-)